VAGNALPVVAGDSVFDEIEALARDRRWAPDIQPLPHQLERCTTASRESPDSGSY